jgi:hypothetical protein
MAAIAAATAAADVRFRATGAADVRLRATGAADVRLRATGAVTRLRVVDRRAAAADRTAVADRTAEDMGVNTTLGYFSA